MPTHIEVGQAGASMIGGNAMVEGRLIVCQTLTPTGVNQPTTMTIPATAGQLFVTITADENVFIAIGAPPDATVPTARRAMSAGTTRSFAFPAGSQVAVVTR